MFLASSSYSYPLLDAFWTILMIFLWVIWFWNSSTTIIIDLFRSHDLSGWAKALWFIFILLLPLIGVLVSPDRPRRLDADERAVRQAQQQETGVPQLCPGGGGFADSGGPAGQAR